jgi:hypothetical protein
VRCGLGAFGLGFEAAFEQVLQPVEVGLPEAFVEGDPCLGCLERFGIESDHAAGSFPLAANQRGALKHVEVLGDGGERHAVRLGEFADRPLVARDVAQDGAPGCVGERVEYGIEGCGVLGGGALFNHMVEYSSTEITCQPFG